MEPLKLRQRAAELMARAHPLDAQLGGAGGDAHRHRTGADALRVVSVDQRSEAALEPARGQDHSIGRDLEVPKRELALRGFLADPWSARAWS